MDLPIRLVGIFSLLATMVVGVMVGVRLLLLARKTRCFPEFAIGLGLMLMTVVGMPLSALGRLPALLRTPAGDFFFASGLGVTCAGLALLWAFTWQVFRKDQAWARGVVIAASLGSAVVAVGLVRASMRAEALPEVLYLTRPFAVAFVALVSGAFAWTGAESILCYRAAKRRQALGLTDVVVVNRFLLWATTGVAMALLTGVMAILLVQGRAILVDPLALSLISVASAVGGTSWYLTFLAPPRYLAYLRRRAAAT